MSHNSSMALLLTWPPKVLGVKGARLLLIATWGVYPITFILAMNNTGAPSFSDVVAREIGYGIADILAKCVFGLIIFTIARIKSGEESKEFAATEFKD
jgi:bacteriorhodopsin